ncbi:MAG TPA: MASE4 domain-containing protein, partial [Xanthobacteraceae bacterium]|nr:MASE4 domain-containing protein [Xanthobacteraceae bacterium]
MQGRDEHSVAASPAARLSLMAAAGIALCLIGGLAAATPFARLPIDGTEGILPAYAAATLVLEIVTAALLFALYTVQRSRAVLILACGYLFSALMIPAWALTFPGVFASLGIEPSLQTAAAVAAARRLGFPLFVLFYALAPNAARPGGPSAGTMIRAVLGVCAGAGLVLWLIFAHAGDLPVLMRDARNADELWRYVPMAALALYALDIGVLLVRRRTPLDIWVSLVVVSLVIELVLISYLGGAVRLGVGWWAGRLYGLAAASIVLFVLLSEVAGLYARLARTLAAERRARQNRLVAMEALSASIAHEINQPLASMVTNADAALRWLSKDQPRLDKADDALRRIVADGHRANKVVAGIRTMFMKGTQERAELDLNALACEAAR